MDEDEGTWIALSAATKNLVVLVCLKEPPPTATAGGIAAGALVTSCPGVQRMDGDEMVKRA